MPSTPQLPLDLRVERAPRFDNYRAADADPVVTLIRAHAEGYPAGEMKHGPIALIDEDLPTVAIATGDQVAEKVRSNMQQVKARDGKVIALVDGDAESYRDVADEVIVVPRISRWLQPIVNVIPLQLLAYYIGVRRGCDVDQPRNLAKSVTVE